MRKYKEGLTRERIADLKFKLAPAEEKENIAVEMIEGLQDQIRDFVDEQEEIESELYKLLRGELE